MHLTNVYWVPSTVLGTTDATVHNIDSNLCFPRAAIPDGETNTQINICSGFQKITNAKDKKD